MANPVLYNNQFSESWNNIYAIINSKTYISDPTTTASEFRKWIYSRDPDIKSTDFGGYPFIVISPSTIDFGNEQTGNRQIKTLSYSFEIDVVTSDREINNREGKGAVDNDAISNDIVESFNNPTVANILAANGLRLINPSSTAMGVELIGETLVYRRSFLLTSINKKKVF